MRGDLAKKGQGRASGCYDTKVTSYLHGFWNLSAEAVNGPSSVASDATHGRSGNPPLTWRASDASTPHWGLPKTYQFDFIRVAPQDLSCSACKEPDVLVV